MFSIETCYGICLDHLKLLTAIDKTRECVISIDYVTIPRISQREDKGIINNILHA